MSRVKKNKLFNQITQILVYLNYIQTLLSFTMYYIISRSTGIIVNRGTVFICIYKIYVY